MDWQENATATVTIVNSGGAATENGVQVAFQYRRVGSGDAGWQDLKDPDLLKDEGGAACDPSNWEWAVRPVQGQATTLSIEAGRNTRVLSVPIDLATHQSPRTCNGESLPARILPGDYELKVIVDPLGRIEEQDRKNNELIIGFSILGSELEAGALELSRSSVERGTDVVVEASVRNTGAKTANAFSVGFFVGATRMDTFHYAGTGLAKDDTVNVQGVIRTQDLAEGEHLVRVVIDPDGQLYEGDTSNNTISAPLVILGLPRRQAELFVDRIVFSPPSPISPGQAFFVRAAVNNAGDLAAERFDVILRVSSAEGGETTGGLAIEDAMSMNLVQSVHRLDPLQTVWLEWPVVGLEMGTYLVRVQADPASDTLPQGRVVERDETNNALLTGFSVMDLADAPVFPSRRPNLACQGLVVTPSAVSTGAAVAVQAVVANLGSEPAGGFDVEWLWVYPTGQSQRLETQRVGPLSAGATIELTRTIDTRSFPHGIHQLILRLDVGDDVEESSTADNVCSASVAIGTTVADPRVDLQPIGVRFDSPGAIVGEGNTVEQDQRLFAYVTIKNQGNVASGPFHVAFSTAVEAGREAWTSVGALDQIEVSHRLPTSDPGEYLLTIEVDPDALLGEDNRANNTITATYTVIASTVTVEEVVPSTGQPARWLASDAAEAKVYAVWVDG
ncbi:MAG TPA: hypothetical protein ENN96_00175, partial [Candidatus Acetothermia bacterium]|nr:hypothetical protein [Candidatus Acetothermia bacterium]